MAITDADALGPRRMPGIDSARSADADSTIDLAFMAVLDVPHAYLVLREPARSLKLQITVNLQSGISSSGPVAQLVRAHA